MDDSSDHPRTSDSEFSTYDDSEDGNSDDDSRDGDALTDHPSGSDSDDDREYDKRHGQSDTETRNLLEDADFEEDILDLDHQSAGPSTIREIPVPPVVVEKPKPSSSSASTDFENDVFAISAEQRAYYMTLFQHLQYVVSGESSLDGSVSGSDDRVVSFFLKSGLDTKSLGKIWDLADINVDGRLNRTEFAVAMHLIVLKTKGGVPIPKRLPAIFDLRPTPPRIDEESPMEVINQSFDVRNGLGNVTHNGRPLPTIFPLPISSSTDSGNKMQSLSDDKLHSLSQRNASAFCPVTEFASDPPMCVDRYPLAVRPTPSTNAPQLTGGTVSLGSQQAFAFPSTLPKGPPPQPPPRSYQKGHARSASLDLNARPPVDFGRAGKQATMPTSGITAFPAPLSTTTVFPPPPPPPSSMAQNLHNQRCLTLPAGSRPTFTAPNFNPHDSSVLTSHLQRLGPTVPPPTLRKISAGGDGGVAHSKTFDSSMTSSALTATSSSSSSSKPPHSSPDSAPPSRPPPPLLPQKPDYHSRCATLRQVNAALEAKLATLSQVRLQLRLRYEEVQGKSSGPNNMQ